MGLGRHGERGWMHGGDISAASGGSTRSAITVRLPLLVSAEVAPERRRDAHSQRSGAHHLADDNKDALEAWR